MGEPRRMAMGGEHRLMGTRADGGHDGMTGCGARSRTRRDAIGKTRRFNELKSQTRENGKTADGDIGQRNRRKAWRA